MAFAALWSVCAVYIVGRQTRTEQPCRPGERAASAALLRRLKVPARRSPASSRAVWRPRSSTLLDFKCGGQADHVHLVLDIHPALDISLLVNDLQTAGAGHARNCVAQHLAASHSKPWLWHRAYFVALRWKRCGLTSTRRAPRRSRKRLQQRPDLGFCQKPIAAAGVRSGDSTSSSCHFTPFSPGRGIGRIWHSECLQLERREIHNFSQAGGESSASAQQLQRPSPWRAPIASHCVHLPEQSWSEESSNSTWLFCPRLKKHCAQR